MSNRFGVSSWLPPAPPRRPYVGGQQFRKGHEQPREAKCRCGYEGPAEWFISDLWEGFTCPKEHGGCGEVVCTYDAGDVPAEDDGFEAHTDPDWLDGPPQSLTDRGDAA